MNAHILGKNENAHIIDAQEWAGSCFASKLKKLTSKLLEKCENTFTDTMCFRVFKKVNCDSNY